MVGLPLFTYVWVIFNENVGICTIHGAYGVIEYVYLSLMHPPIVSRGVTNVRRKEFMWVPHLKACSVSHL